MNKRIRRFSLFLVAVAAASLALAASRSSAQFSSGADHLSVTLSDPSRPALVKASLVNGGIVVKGYEGKEIIVEARARNRETEKPSGGTKRLNISTTGLSVEEENNEVRIGTESYVRPIDLTISVPVHTSLKLRAVNDGNIVVTGVDGELDVDDVNGFVTLNDVSGNAVAHALNGRVLATFRRVNPQKPMAFSSLNGDIDVTFPADLKASVSIRSDQGDVFSDFDLQLQARAPQQIVENGRGHGGKYRVKVDRTVHGTINGGGPEIQFTNFQGSIYIRKAGQPPLAAVPLARLYELRKATYMNMLSFARISSARKVISSSRTFEYDPQIEPGILHWRPDPPEARSMRRLSMPRISLAANLLSLSHLYKDGDNPARLPQREVGIRQLDRSDPIKGNDKRKILPRTRHRNVLSAFSPSD